MIRMGYYRKATNIEEKYYEEIRRYDKYGSDNDKGV